MEIFGDDVDPDDNFGPDFPDYFRISHLLEQWSIAQLGTPSHLYDFVTSTNTSGQDSQLLQTMKMLLMF